MNNEINQIEEYILESYKIDSSKAPSHKFKELYKNTFIKLINDNDNLDIQQFFKIIDTIQLEEYSEIVNSNNNEIDLLYIKALYITILSLQMNLNANKKEIFIKFIEKNLGIFKHEVIFLLDEGVFTLYLQTFVFRNKSRIYLAR